MEDCSGCPYNLTDEDDAFLKSMNSRLNASTQCSEDQFEEVMNFLEETAQANQPYASVDNPPVLEWEEMESALDENFEIEARKFARDIYEHWKARRLKAGNRILMPSLKVRGAHRDKKTAQLTYSCSSKLEQKRTMGIHTCASAEEKSGKFARLVAETPRAQRNSRN